MMILSEDQLSSSIGKEILKNNVDENVLTFNKEILNFPSIFIPHEKDVMTKIYHGLTLRFNH